jgi:hypothetical protein
MPNKFTIKRSDLDQIRCFAKRRFDDHRGFKDLSQQDVSALLIIEGLYDFLKQKGIEPPFKVED